MRRMSWVIGVGMLALCLMITGCGCSPIVLPVVVPNVVPMQESAANTAIIGAGLVIGTVTKQCSNRAVGTVLSQTPPGGAFVTPGSPVNMVVSSGPCLNPVPDVVGETLGGAGATLVGAGFVTGNVTHQCSDTVAEGIVISQDPVAGTQAAPGSTVDLVISTGPCNVIVPNVVGQTLTAAGTTLTGSGVVTGVVTYQCSDTVKAGVVISEDPVAGTSVVPGSAVNLVVSTGLCPVVPNVVGETQAAAGTAIAGVNLTTGTVTQQCSDSVAAGLAISQSPLPGTQVAPGSAVDYVLSTGPCLIAVPAVIDQTQAAADTTLTGAGLSVGAVTQECSNTVAAGSVVSETPPASTLVASGTPVNLVISTGLCNVIVLPGNVPLEMVFVPCGSFLMGRYAGEQGSYSNEDPQHPVTIANGFWMGKYELTQAQWVAVTGTNPSYFTGDLQRPVDTVSWNAITQTFLPALNTATGLTFRLPSEAEWEYACRAGDQTPPTRYYWGDDPGSTQIGSYAWYVTNSGLTTHAVGTAGTTGHPNAFGLYDMNGNVAEWCQDWFHGSYSGAPTDGSAWELPVGTGRVARGGTLNDNVTACRSATRITFNPVGAGFSVGFRVAISTNLCSQNTAVPDVVGQTQTVAGTTLAGTNLSTGTVTGQCSDVVAVGLVISENPPAGTLVASGSAVSLVVSTGPCLVAVPDVVGQTQAGAGITLTGAGLGTGTVTQQCSDTVAAGLVVSEDPPAGTLVAPGTPGTPSTLVALVVSTGPCPVTVPGVVGLSQSTGGIELTSVNLTVGMVTQQCSDTAAPGVILSQAPLAGDQVPPGSAVDLVVSSGPCNATVPDVAGQTQAAAGTTITGVNLTVGTVTEQCSDTVAAGLVISQDPLAGAQAVPGSAVNLVISTGLCNAVITLPGGVTLDIVWVPGGNFQMGSPDAEQERNAPEGPQHPVTVNGFWMGKYELTKRQWQAVTGAMVTPPWAGQSSVLADPDSPAVFVSWDAAQSFVTALNNYTGQTFRLPSEAEWEYACRAGTSSRFYWGDDLNSIDISGYAWWHGNADAVVGQQFAHIVGTKTANSFGLFDMSGNAWEWAQDWYHDNYANAPSDGSAWEVPIGTSRVLRSGSWTYWGGNCRSATRFGMASSFADAGSGMRLAK